MTSAKKQAQWFAHGDHERVRPLIKIDPSYWGFKDVCKLCDHGVDDHGYIVDGMYIRSIHIVCPGTTIFDMEDGSLMMGP